MEGSVYYKGKLVKEPVQIKKLFDNSNDLSRKTPLEPLSYPAAWLLHGDVIFKRGRWSFLRDL